MNNNSPRQPHRLRRAVLAGAITAVLASAAAAQGASEPIRMGAIFSVTGPGAATGYTGLTGTKLAVKEINAAGGIMGRPVELFVGDDAFDPTQAVAEAKRLVSKEKVQLMVGPTVSQVTLAIAPVLTQARVASVSLTGSSALTPQIAPYTFSMWTSIEAQGQAMTDYAVKHLKVKSAAIIADNGAQGKAGVAIFQRLLAAQGVKVTGVQEHEPLASDLTAQILALKRGNPDAIFQISTAGEDSGVVFRTMGDIGWDAKVLSMVAGLTVPMVIRKSNPDVFKQGNIYATMLKAYTYCPKDAGGPTEFGKFVTRLKAFDPKNFDKLNPQVVSMTYDSVYVLKAAVEATKSFDGPTLSNWIEKNAPAIKGRVNGALSAGALSHFLVGVDAIAMVRRPDVKREDGSVQRAECN
ncbi:amino acid ABC transporter substrate-binding protein [Pandoraea terrae]|uniref:Amino acid ABC transporter substrate-binding protein n=1 Tax=Pandoraea terrae TaxID=1537710 RepID=A0A5E4S0K3_9BURK|nr:ABC transporter substrate-binding protein [Pandoraea terrae]VVD68661.1 amino acid ABC transporter substrate-binding protein [Pandoraea terrae]